MVYTFKQYHYNFIPSFLELFFSSGLKFLSSTIAYNVNGLLKGYNLVPPFIYTLNSLFKTLNEIDFSMDLILASLGLEILISKVYF